MFSPSEQPQAHFIICSLPMTNHTINGETLKLDSTHSKNQEIIGSLNQQVQDNGLLSQPLTQINSYLVSKMKVMDKNLLSEPIHS
jgi:cell division protein FtsL